MRTFQEALKVARDCFADGLVEGQPIGKLAKSIVIIGVDHGIQHAKHDDFFFAETDISDIKELRREAAMMLFEKLYKQQYMLIDIIQDVFVLAAAYGFKSQRALKG